MSSNMPGYPSAFPLRTNFFRSMPLTAHKNDLLYTQAKANATACLNQSFNDQWRYVPPEKDGTQIRKDTSNMTASYRLVRAATVLRCQEHEVNQVIANTSTESWREFARKCFAKYYMDTMILHTVETPRQKKRAQRKQEQEMQRSMRSESQQLQQPSIIEDDDNQSESRRSNYWVHNESAVSTEDSAPVLAYQRCSSNSSSVDGAASSGTGSSNQDEAGSNNQEEDDMAVGEQAEELLTIKWAAFDSSMTGKCDVCLVDYLSLAYIPNTEKKERVHLWCFTSALGDQVGCMELKETHGIVRTELTKLGVFWRKLSEEETEVIICGSFPSKYAQAASAIILSCLQRLQGIVEDLRMSSQLYLHRSTWIKDKERTNCHLCMRHFYALRRKHHCRKCGEVICSDCSTVEIIDLPVIGTSKLRLCKVCCIRAKSTPLKRLDKTNVFDHLVRARSLSNLHATSSSYSRTSYAESKHDMSEFSNTGIENSAVLQAMGMGVDTRTHSCSSFSSSSNNNDMDHDSFDVRAEHMSRQHSTSVAAAVHPVAHAGDYDDFMDGRLLKQQLSALEQQTKQNGTTTSNSNMFDLLCELACQTLNCPIASVSILNPHGESVRSAAGLDGNPALDGELTMFIDQVMGSTPAIVLDANMDKQVQQLFAKRGQPAIRFFAGCPIYSRTGKKLGYVCVADLTKRDTLGASCAFTMERLATLAVTTMERNVATASVVHPVPNATSFNQPMASAVRAESTAAPPTAIVDRVFEVMDDVPTDVGSPMYNGTSAAPPANRYGDYNAAYYEAQERMRKLLLKSYHTQQQLASGGSPTMHMSPSSTY